MNLGGNSLLGLAVLGVGGFLIWQQMRKGGIEEEAVNLSVPLTPQEASAIYTDVGKTWEEKLAGEPLPNGDRIFRPLDTDAENPLRMYYAVVKTKKYVPNAGTPTIIGVGYPTVGEIYLFNTLTGREVRLDELAKSKTMTEDAKRGVQETFANAFLFACNIYPRYLPWVNNISLKYGQNCNAMYDTSM